MIVPLLSAQASAEAVDEPPLAEIQELGPGQYATDNGTFKIAELDVSAGLISRKHGVAMGDGNLARPQSAPSTRPELGVFGPGWLAEFAGGQLNRRLEVQNGAIVITELDDGTSARYTLKSSVAFPDGGGIQTYETTDGAKLTETTRWDAAIGAMRTTTSETIAIDQTVQDPDDAPFTNDDGTPISAADLAYTYTWARQSGLSSTDTWRVTSVGNTAFGKSTVAYDGQGRISTIKEPAGAETPESVLRFTYATTTTATGTSVGDFAGRLKNVTVAYGTEAPQTQASYGYDTSGLLRTVNDPSSGTGLANYAYDPVGRLTSIQSVTNGGWQMSFPAGAAAPQVSSTDLDLPVAGGPIEGATGINDPAATEPPLTDFLPEGIDPPQAYPKKCSTAANWMWYTKIGCSAWAAHYGWHKPGWKRTASGYKVMGINHDHCTSSADRPSGFDFRPACDSHDYGYGLIGNTYKGYKYYLDRSRKADVDSRFYITMRDKVCNGYFILVRGLCKKIAGAYWLGVRLKGKPKNGADATKRPRP
ncbi:phospholipase A2 [Nonomuraea solani]|nr:phospholipase A2 [Nonomuraea solani]